MVESSGQITLYSGKAELETIGQRDTEGIRNFEVLVLEYANETS